MSRRTRYLTPLALLAGSCLALPAAADDLYSGLRTPHTSWSAFAGVTSTDDATLLPGGPSDTIATGGLGLSLYRDTGRLRADIDSSVRYEDYLKNTYTSHVLGSVIGEVRYAMVPERLEWVLQDTYGQLAANTLLPTTPANRLNANSVTTGPEGTMRLGAGLDLLLGARYSQADFQAGLASQFSNHAVSGHAGLLGHLSELSSLSLNVSGQKVDYKDSGIPGYKQFDAYLRYEQRTRRSGIAVDVGGSQIEDSGVKVNDPLARLTLFHRLTRSWNLNAQVGTEFQNSGSAFQSAFGNTRVVNGQVVSATSGAALPGSAVADLVLGQTAFRSDYATATIDYLRPRTQLTLGGGFSRQTFEFSNGSLDRRVTTLTGSLQHKLRPTLSAELDASLARRTPEASLPGDRTTTASAGLNWRPGALLQLNLQYTYTDRTADATGAPYRQQLVYLGITYGPPRPVVRFDPVGAPSSTSPSIPR